jgi:protoporphyrinogen oxidase
MPNKREKITIIGGGITGLAAAYIAMKNDWDVTVLEASAQPGGLLRTFDLDGTNLECFYHHFFTHDLELLWLLKELELDSKVTFTKTTMGVYKNGRAYDFNGASDLFKFKPFNIVDILRFGLTSAYLGRFADWEKYETVSAISWLTKYSGKNVTDTLWRPLLEAKFGSQANSVPVSWFIGRLSQRMRSRSKTSEQLGYIEGSLKTFVETLVNKLKQGGVNIVLNAEVSQLNIVNNELVGIQTKTDTYTGGKFLVTVSNRRLAGLLRNYPDIASQLAEIKYLGAVCVILETTRQFSDYYWLNIADKGSPFVGVIEHTNFISAANYHGKHVVYLTQYFNQGDLFAKASDEKIQELMLAGFKQIYKDFSDNDLIKTYVFKTLEAAPVCDLNFSKKVPAVKSSVDNMYIVNMAHIYPDERSMNNSIRTAATACKVMGMAINFIPEGTSLSGKIGVDVC